MPGQVRACLDELVQQCLVQVFVLPPSAEELGQRLMGRGTESQASVDLRMTNAIAEMEHWPAYDYALVSASRESDYERFRALLVAQRMRCELQR